MYRPTLVRRLAAHPPPAAMVRRRAAPISADALVTRMAGGSGTPAPLLILDTRTRLFSGSELDAEHAPAHIRGAVAIQVPTLLLRRNSRPRAGSPSVSGDALLSYVGAPHDLAHMGTLLHAAHPSLPLAAAFTHLDTAVVYEETPPCSMTAGLTRLDSSEVAARVLLECLEGLPGPGCVYFLEGGFAALRRVAGAEACLVHAPSAHAPMPTPAPSALSAARRPQRIALPHIDTKSIRQRSASVTIAELESPRMSTQCMSRALSAGDSVDALCDDDDPGFAVSTIVPGELYLGPDIRGADDIAVLQRLGVRAVLNTAFEIPDGGSDGCVRTAFARYTKIALRDTVEATGIQQGIRTACAFIDDALLHSAPVYVHCRAGKSRSVLLVLAYLMHARRWPLRRAYAHVLSCHADMCPNIGFIAELMRFEERTLGTLGAHVTSPTTPTAARRRRRAHSELHVPPHAPLHVRMRAHSVHDVPAHEPQCSSLP